SVLVTFLPAGSLIASLAVTLLGLRLGEAFFRFEGVKELIQTAEGVALELSSRFVGRELLRLVLYSFQMVSHAQGGLCHGLGGLGHDAFEDAGARQLFLRQVLGFLSQALLDFGQVA